MFIRIPDISDVTIFEKIARLRSRGHKGIIESYDSIDGLRNFSPFGFLTSIVGGTIDEPTVKVLKSTFDDNARKVVGVLEDVKFPNDYSEVAFIAEAKEILEKGTVEEELETGEKIVSCGITFLQCTSLDELDFLGYTMTADWVNLGSNIPIMVNEKDGTITNANVFLNPHVNKRFCAFKVNESGGIIPVTDPEELSFANVASKKIIICRETPLRWFVDGEKAMTIDTPLISTPFEDYSSSRLKSLLVSREYQATIQLDTDFSKSLRAEESSKPKNPFTVGQLTLDQQIKRSLRIGVIPFLVGPPGIGKTEIIESQSKHVLTYNMATWSPASFTGKDYVLPGDQVTSTDENGVTITHTEKALTDKAKPQWLTDVERELELAKKDGEDVILFLDEFDKLTPDLQVFVNGIISNKPTLGDWPVPEGVKIVLAGNTTVDSLASNKISSEVSSRLMPIKVKVNVDEWLRWAIDKNIDPIVISYIATHKDDLLTVEKGPDGRACADISMNPRKWVKMVDKGIKESRVTGEPLMINNYMTEEQVKRFMDFIDKYYNSGINEILDGTAPLHVTYDIGHNSFVLNVLSTIAKPEQLRNVLPFITDNEYRVFFVRNWLSYHPNKKTEVYEILQELQLSEGGVQNGLKI